MSPKQIKTNCPYCGKKDTWQADNPFRPFCSERCKLIDLGGWAAEKYQVLGEPIASDIEGESDPDGEAEKYQVPGEPIASDIEGESDPDGEADAGVYD